MSKKPTFRGRVLSSGEMKLLRRKVEDFDSIDVVDGELRELIEREWPDLAGRLPPRKPN